MHISENRKANSFPKSEKLKLKKQIETLFREGKAFQFEYIRCIFHLENNSSSPELIKFGVSIPKKKIPKAHDRNTCKRRIREAFRINKVLLYPNIPTNTQLHIFIVYQKHKSVADYYEIEGLMKQVIQKLNKSITTLASNH